MLSVAGSGSPSGGRWLIFRRQLASVLFVVNIFPYDGAPGRTTTHCLVLIAISFFYTPWFFLPTGTLVSKAATPSTRGRGPPPGQGQGRLGQRRQGRLGQGRQGRLGRCLPTGFFRCWCPVILFANRNGVRVVFFDSNGHSFRSPPPLTILTLFFLALPPPMLALSLANSLVEMTCGFVVRTDPASLRGVWGEGSQGKGLCIQRGCITLPPLTVSPPDYPHSKPPQSSSFVDHCFFFFSPLTIEHQRWKWRAVWLFQTGSVLLTPPSLPSPQTPANRGSLPFCSPPPQLSIDCGFSQE